jgi:hypothetical protein
MAAQLASMTDLINRQLETLRQLDAAAPLTARATVPAPVQQQAPAPLPEKPLLEKKPVEAFGPFKPFSQEGDAGLDAGQRRFLADLIARTQAARAVPRK